jgi:hypothetical protein
MDKIEKKLTFDPETGQVVVMDDKEKSAAYLAHNYAKQQDEHSACYKHFMAGYNSRSEEIMRISIDRIDRFSALCNAIRKDCDNMDGLITEVTRKDGLKFSVGDEIDVYRTILKFDISLNADYSGIKVNALIGSTEAEYYKDIDELESGD